MSASNTSYRRDLHALARQHGRTLELTKGCHFRLIRAGFPPVICARSPRSPHRTIRNTRALLRRQDKETHRS